MPVVILPGVDPSGVPTGAAPLVHQHVAADVTDFAAAVQLLIDQVVDGAPGVLNTLKEIAAALGNDPNLSATLTALIGQKLAKADNLSDVANKVTALLNLLPAVAGKNGKILAVKADSSGVEWIDPPAGGGMPINYTVANPNIEAIKVTAAAGQAANLQTFVDEGGQDRSWVTPEGRIGSYYPTFLAKDAASGVVKLMNWGQAHLLEVDDFSGTNKKLIGPDLKWNSGIDFTKIATGTPSASTVLYGNGTWGTLPAAGVSQAEVDASVAAAKTAAGPYLCQPTSSRTLFPSEIADGRITIIDNNTASALTITMPAGVFLTSAAHGNTATTWNLPADGNVTVWRSGSFAYIIGYNEATASGAASTLKTVRATMGGTNLTLAHATYTAVPLSTETFDDGGYWNNSTYSLTLPAGDWELVLSCTFANVQNMNRELRFTKNGTTQGSTQDVCMATAGQSTVTHTDLVRVNGTDVIVPQVYQTSGGSSGTVYSSNTTRLLVTPA